MSFIDQLAEALKPHTVALGGKVGSVGDNINNKLEEILQAIIASGPNRPGADDLWQYCNFSCAGAQATPAEFGIPVTVPANEIWVVQAITLLTAASVNALT